MTWEQYLMFYNSKYFSNITEVKDKEIIERLKKKYNTLKEKDDYYYLFFFATDKQGRARTVALHDKTIPYSIYSDIDVHVYCPVTNKIVYTSSATA